jgi:hypothetical protein
MTLRDGGLEGLLASIVSSIECPARERHSNWISSNVDIITRPVFYFALFFALFTFGLSFRGLGDVLCAPLRIDRTLTAKVQNYLCFYPTEFELDYIFSFDGAFSAIRASVNRCVTA